MMAARTVRIDSLVPTSSTGVRRLPALRPDTFHRTHSPYFLFLIL